jgi:hypothetical protein
MAQPRKKSGRRTSSAKKAATEGVPTPTKRTKSKPAEGKQVQPKAALPEPASEPAERSAGPVNPDSMSAEVIEFITAVDEYKRKRGRPFPSWSEILEIVKQLGYRKAA